MADFSNIYNEIDANVNANGQQKITGPVLNKTLKDMLQEVDSEKQDTLVAGQNIQINGNVISASGGGSGEEYYAGNGLELNGNVFSVKPSDIAGHGLGEDGNGKLAVMPYDIAGHGLTTEGDALLAVDPSGLAGHGLEVDGDGRIEINPGVVQEKLQAGSNITIYGNTISATDTNTTYSAGQGLELNGTTFAVKAGSGLGFDANGNLVNTGGGGGGTTYTAGDGIEIDQNDAINAKLGNGLQLDGSNNIEINPSVVATQSDLSGKQNTLQAGSNIQINGNVISATDTNTTYSAGSGLNLNGTTFSVDTTAIQEKLTAGQNITISGNVISAAGGSGATYSAGQGINIDQNNEISVKASDLVGPYLGTLSDGRLFANADLIAQTIDGNGLQYNSGTGEIDVDTSVIQEKLVAGQNITISGNVISAAGGSSSSYSAGTGINIDSNNVISNTAPDPGLWVAGTGTNSIKSTSASTANGNNALAVGANAKANGNQSVALGQGASSSGVNSTAIGANASSSGTGSTAIGNNVSAPNLNETALGKYNLPNSSSNNNEMTAFTIGNGANSSNKSNVLEIKANNDAYLSGVGGYTGTNASSADTLQDVINGKQDTLTAGSGISIQNNVISATGGGGSGLWTSGTGTGSVMSPGAFQANGNNSVSAGDYTRSNGTSSIALGTSTTTTGLSSVAIGANSTAAGSYSVALGHGLGAVNSDETALGKFNNYIDTGTTAEKTFFTVGNGTSNNTKSNVLEVKQNNDIYVSGIGGFDGTNASSADTLQDVIAGKQDTLVAGSNITISGNVISATGGGGGSYTASHGIDITNDAISVDVSDLNGTGLIADHQRGILEVDFTTVQGKLTAGSGITISGNTISSTGGSGNYLPLTGGQLQANPSDAETVLDVAAPDSTAAVSISADTIDSKLAISADKENAGISDGDTFRTVFTNTGEINVDAKTVNPLDPTDITSTTYTLVLPQKNDTIATLSDIQGAGSSYSAGTGINIDSNNVISNTAPDPGLWVAGTGTNSIRSSNATSASGNNSISIGDHARATNIDSISIGGWSSAGGTGSISLGYNSSTTNSNSASLGYYATAVGASSTAIGHNSNAKNQSEIGIGKYNNSIDSGTTAEKTQFTVGNGTSSAARSNLIEAKQNNDIYIYGVGGFDGTNAGTSGVETLQQAIANAGGGGSSYSAGQAIDITNGAISVDYGSGLGLGTNGELQVEWSEGPTALAGSGLSANTQNGQLDVDFTSVQGKLTAGTGITISGNTISATGGGGSCLWSSGTGQDSLVSPGAASTQGADAAGIGAIVIGEDSIAGGDYSFAHGQSSVADGAYSAAFVNSNSTGDYSFAAGSGADAQADYSVALGGGIVVSDDSDPENPIDALRGVAIGEGATVNGVCGLAFMGGTATGEYSVAIGESANATEMYSTALTGSTASGNYSFAASTGVAAANAHYSTALSGGTVYGEGSLASGFENKVYGYCSAALGYKLSTYDQADGTSDTDPNTGEVALGRYNYSEQDIIFSIGCGYYDDSDPNNPQEVRQNAVAITNDGKIYIKGLGQYTGTQVAGCTDLVSFLNSL